MVILCTLVSTRNVKNNNNSLKIKQHFPFFLEFLKDVHGFILNTQDVQFIEMKIQITCRNSDFQMDKLSTRKPFDDTIFLMWINNKLETVVEQGRALAARS